MTQTSTMSTTLSNISSKDILETSLRALNRIKNTLRIISKAWEESRVEYKKHAILGGGWE